MPIRFYCDKCEEEINQKGGFGKFNVLEKNYMLRGGKTVPAITEEIYYLCSKCSEYLIKEIKNFQRSNK